MMTNRNRLAVILNDHFRRYPEMQVQDLYKLLHQAALGSAHAVTDEASARRALQAELQTLGEGPAEPLLDPVSPDGRMARVHLRSWLLAGKDPEVLLNLFLRTANEWRSLPRRLAAYGRSAVQWAAGQTCSFQAEELADFLARMAAAGYPPVHHSQVYARLYRPAYRLVGGRNLEAV